MSTKMEPGAPPCLGAIVRIVVTLAMVMFLTPAVLWLILRAGLWFCWLSAVAL